MFFCQYQGLDRPPRYSRLPCCTCHQYGRRTCRFWQLLRQQGVINLELLMCGSVTCIKVRSRRLTLLPGCNPRAHSAFLPRGRRNSVRYLALFSRSPRTYSSCHPRELCNRERCLAPNCCRFPVRSASLRRELYNGQYFLFLTSYSPRDCNISFL
jgi:hypothetical protein